MCLCVQIKSLSTWNYSFKKQVMYIILQIKTILHTNIGNSNYTLKTS